MSYWSKFLNARIRRRRAVAVSSAAVFGMALLAACGDGGGGGESSGLIHKPLDVTKQAKQGGVFKDGARTDVSTLDPYTLSSSEPRRQFVWSRLTRIKSGILEPSTGEIEPDVAESWEFSPDKLQMTVKLRRNARWDHRPPTNSRPVDAQDVVFSWDRLSKLGARRADYVNTVNPSAPVVSVSAPDQQTVVLKLAFPDADLLTLLAATAAGNFHVLPREADGGFDIRKENRGSGPYYMSDYVPSVKIEYKRSPNYYLSNEAFVETWEVPILTEYAQSLAQLRAGALYRFPENLRPEDVVPTKRDVPQLLMVQTDVATETGVAMYGWEDGPNSPFRDERLRQAFSMTLDRDLWIDTFYTVSDYRSQGLPMETVWNSVLRCDDFGWWLDPQGRDFGPNAKYYKRDIAEAKKLVAAAGFPNGLDTNGHYVSTGQYGRDHERMIQVQIGMAAEAGIRIKSVTHNYTSEWGPKYRDANGNFDGIAWLNISVLSDAGAILGMFNLKGSLFKGFSADGKSTFAGDPYLNDLTTKIKQEFDRPKRFALAHELQRYVAKTQHYTRFPGGASGFNLGWPAIGNFGVYRLGTNPDLSLWIDQGRPPLKS